MAFVDEINQIRENNKQQIIVVNSKETLAEFKEKSKEYIAEICNQIRSDIKREAQMGRIKGDKNEHAIFQKGKLLNSHYSTRFESLIRVNTTASIFSYETLECCEPYGEPETRKGFVVNDAKTIEFVLSQIEKELLKDKIYYVCVKNTNPQCPSHGYWKTQREKAPVAEKVNKINAMLAKRKKDPTAYMYDIFISWGFAYFI